MAHDPLLLSTAVEAVLHAGRMQVAALGQHIRIDKKGVIDLVTEVDLAVETWFRAFIQERFPEHRILAEEFQGRSEQGVASSPYCWIFDPIDGTTNYAHGLPIFCASLALEIDGRIEVAAVYDPTRQELFTAERGGGAFLNGAPIRVSSTTTLIDALLCTGFHYQCTSRPMKWSACSRSSSAAPARCGGSARRPSISATSPAAGSTASGKNGSARGMWPAGCC